MEEIIIQELIDLSKSFPAVFNPIKNDLLSLEFVIAERKAFLTKQKLTYNCRVKIIEGTKEIRIFEILKESGSGLSIGGGEDDFGPGFGFKVEKTKIGFSGREGTIEEQSVLFSKRYQYNFSYEKIRKSVEETALKFGYSLIPVLTQKGF